MIAVALAWAHPVGGHAVTHAVDLHVGVHTAEIRYRVEVPRALVRSPEATIRELESGLRLVGDGATHALRRRDVAWEATEHGLGVDLVLHAEGSPTEWVLENGNLPDTVGFHVVDVTVDGALRVTDSSLWVFHEGALVRSENGRKRTAFAARTTRLVLDRPVLWLDRLYRLLQARPRHAGLPEPTPFTTNRTHWAAAWIATFLAGLVAAYAPRPRKAAVWIGLAAIATLDALTTDLASRELALAALACAALGLRFPSLRTLVGALLAASLDYRLAVAFVLGAQLSFAEDPPPPPVADDALADPPPSETPSLDDLPAGDGASPSRDEVPTLGCAGLVAIVAVVVTALQVWRTL